jgi:hypothetical protein
LDSRKLDMNDSAPHRTWLPRLVHRVCGDPALLMVIGVIVMQTTFTAAVRFYVVPHLLPHTHAHSGLRQASDSIFFHDEAAKLSQRLRTQGWTALSTGADAGLSHVKIIAAIYYIAGHDNPVAVYAVNVVIACISALLILALGRRLGLGQWVAAAAAALLASGPMFLFAHSELLREPFILASFLTFVLGVYVLIDVDDRVGGPHVVRQATGALACAFAFIATSLFRPYLMLPMMVALATTFTLAVLLPWAARSTQRISVKQGMVMASLFAGLMTFWVVPAMDRVSHYTDADAGAGPSALRESSDRAKRQLRRKIEALSSPADQEVEAAALNHDDTQVPIVCSVNWQATPWVPASLDKKAEALACARESHLVFCDPAVMGTRVDRRCDQTTFRSFGDVLKHLPAATLWSLAVPYPNMWLDAFGNGGTGLRRAGYVIDGLVSYALLPGLIGLLWNWKRRPFVVALAAGLLAMLVIYGLGVPSQFLLARMRLAIYLPLLLMGMYGWTLTSGLLSREASRRLDGRIAQPIGD